MLVTEKLTQKKELDRVNNDFRKLKKEYKEQRVNFNLLMDEISKANKQNAEYRTLVLNNEKELGKVASEITDLQ